MSARRARTRLLGAVSVLVLALGAPAACGSSDLSVGDDARDAPDGAGSEASLPPDSSAPDTRVDSTTGKDTGTDARADVDCPVLSPPAPGFCDGGPFAPRYSGDGCVIGFACTPFACASGGGTCVAAGTCATGHVGDAAKYTCAGASDCCLP